MPDFVRCEIDEGDRVDGVGELGGGLATLTLHAPARLNAMSRSMWLELQAHARRLAQMPALRCIVLRGEGGHFCAGGNIAEYPGFRFDEAQLRQFHEQEVWGALQALLDCDMPLVAAIEGNCMGAGLEIASCCDIRIATDTARFGAPIARLGFAMAPRELQLVLGQVGATAARSMLLEAALLDAPEMLQRGFLTRVVPPAALAASVAHSVQRIQALAPQAARMHKRSIRALAQPPDATVVEAMVQGAYDYADSPEHREGVTAFLDKRPAQFARD